MIEIILNQIINKIFIILILSLIIQGLKESGLVAILLSPFQKIKNLKIALITWFLLGSLLSAFTVDLNAAVILCPLIIYYCNTYNIQLNRELFLVSGIIGIAVGGDLSKYGGGDNILLAGLFESHFNIPLTNYLWNSYIVPPTILLMIISIFIIIHFIQKEEIDFSNSLEIKQKLNKKSTFLFFISLIFVFNNSLLLSIITLIIGLSFLENVNDIFKQIPYKTLIIWTIAFLIGKLLGLGLNEIFNFSNFDVNKTLLLFIFAGISFILTAICTQTFVTSMIMDTVFTIFGLNYPAIMLIIKSINSGYLTILSNGCLVVGQSYGVSQKTLFKIGLILLIPQIIVPIIWYFILI